MKTTRSILLLSLLAACSSPAVCGCAGDDGGLPDGELPDSFRVDAEIVSVTPAMPVWSLVCTPRAELADPAGPDWRLKFERVHDPAEPTFSATGSDAQYTDSAARCASGGEEDCCEPLVTTDGGWRLVCDGSRFSGQVSAFTFDFAADGSGTGTTVTAASDGTVYCTSTVEWSAITPL